MMQNPVKGGEIFAWGPLCPSQACGAQPNVEPERLSCQYGSLQLAHYNFSTSYCVCMHFCSFMENVKFTLLYLITLE